MLGCTRQTLFACRAGWCGLFFVFLILGFDTQVWGQDPATDERPLPYAGKAPTRKDVERRDSLHQYVLGLLLERADKIVEALRAFEEAARLDPEQPAVFKAQVVLLLAMNREKDALATVSKVLELDPSDHEMWFLAGRLNRAMGNDKEARLALKRGLEAPGIQDHPDAAQQIYLDLGAMCEAAGEIPQAIAAFTGAVKILDHPDLLMEHGPFNRDSILARSAETHERLGNLYRKGKKFDEAVAEYKKAQATSPERAGRLNFSLAQLLQEQGRFEQSLGYLDAYLRFQPLGTEAYEMKIVLLEKLKRQEEVVPWLKQASSADPNNIGLKVFLAKQYARANQYNHAETIFKKLAEESPNPDIYQGLFHLYQGDKGVGMRMTLELLNNTIEEAAKAKGPPGLAAQQAKAMIAALRDDPPLAKDLVEVAFRRADGDLNLQFETLHLLGVIADKHLKLPEAERFFRKSLQNAGPGTEAVVYGSLLRVLWKEQKFAEIVQLCREGLLKSRATNQILFHNELAKALARLDKMDEALQEADRAIQFAGDSDKLVVRNLRVRILMQAEKYDEAEKDCVAMLQQYSAPADIVDIRYLLSAVYNANRQLAKSEEQLETILKIDPTNATVNNDLGYTWADQNKNLEKAEEMIRLAIEMDRRQRQMSRTASADADQENAAYIDSLGWVLFRRGKNEEACKQLELAVHLPEGAEDSTVWDHLGDVYYRLERVDQARAAWERSNHLFEKENRRKMDERHQEVQRKLKMLDK
jgi:tetratricopeptide (TPR) repeat protein